MAAPSDVSFCRLTFGPYRDARWGAAMSGVVGELVPSRVVRHPTTGEVVVPASVPVIVGQDGSAHVDVPHTDLPTLAPLGAMGFLYTFTWRQNPPRGLPRSKTFALPAVVGATTRYDELVPSTLANVLVPIAVPVALVEELEIRVEAAEEAATQAAGMVATATDAATAAAVSADTAAATAAASVTGALATVGTSGAVGDTLVRRDPSGDVAVRRLILTETTGPSEAVRKDYADALGTSVATANTIVRRSGVGWFAAAGISGLGLPGSPGDAASKAYVDALGTPSATVSTIARRDGAGRTLFSSVGVTDAPTSVSDLTRKDYVDGQIQVSRRPARRFINTSQTIALTDEANVIAFDTANAPLTLTVPTDAALSGFPIGGWVEIEKAGSSANALTITPSGGVTIRNPNGGNVLNALNSRVRLTKLAPDIWLLTDISGATATPAVVGDALVRRTAGGSVSFQNVDIVAQPTTVAHAVRKDYADALGTEAATGGTIARRGAAGDLAASQFIIGAASPTTPGHATRKDYVDALGTPNATANTVARRDASGDISVNNITLTGAAPAFASHATRKDYVDALGVGDAATANTVVRRNGNGDVLTRLTHSTLAPTNPEHLTRKDYVDALGDSMIAQVPATVGGAFPGTALPFENARQLTLTANATLSSLPTNPATTRAGSILLTMKQAATGGPYTMTWPAALVWAGGAPAPTMPTVANAELIVQLLWNGAAWRAVLVGTFFP